MPCALRHGRHAVVVRSRRCVVRVGECLLRCRRLQQRRLHPILRATSQLSLTLARPGSSRMANCDGLRLLLQERLRPSPPLWWLKSVCARPPLGDGARRRCHHSLLRRHAMHGRRLRRRGDGLDRTSFRLRMHFLAAHGGVSGCAHCQGRLQSGAALAEELSAGPRRRLGRPELSGFQAVGEGFCGLRGRLGMRQQS